jgi:hypothetical protein
MRIRNIFFATALSVAFVSSSMAGLVGSAYDGTLATPDTDWSVSPTGTNAYTDVTEPLSFCASGTGTAGCGLSGEVSFSDVDADESDITFEFSGSVSAAAGDTFTVDLGDFVSPTGTVIASLDPTANSLTDGAFQLTSFNGSDAIFTGTVGADGSLSAGAGQAIVFHDALVPEPASILLSGFGLAALALAARRRSQDRLTRS